MLLPCGAATGETERADSLQEVTIRLENLRERLWKIEEDASRARSVDVAVGVMAGVGARQEEPNGDVDEEKPQTSVAVQGAPIVAGRFYFFDSERSLAARAAQRLNYLQNFSLPDAKRALSTAERDIEGRERALKERLEDILKERDSLQALMQEALETLSSCKNDEDVDQSFRVDCAEARDSVESVNRRSSYVKELTLDLDEEKHQIDEASLQIANAKKELERLNEDLRTMLSNAERAERGFLLGGVFLEGFVGYAMNLYPRADAPQESVVGGVGYGLGSLSVGVYIGVDSLGGYLATTIPLLGR